MKRTGFAHCTTRLSQQRLYAESQGSYFAPFGYMQRPCTVSDLCPKNQRLRINADFSHFVVVCESLFAAEEDYNYLRTIIPHVSICGFVTQAETAILMRLLPG